MADDGISCKDCGAEIEQQAQKALDGNERVCWTNVVNGDWVCIESANEHVPGAFQLTAKEALDAGIFAINTLLEPSASSAEDQDWLDRISRHATVVLAEVREWVIAQGEDFEERLAEDRGPDWADLSIHDGTYRSETFDDDGNRLTPAEVPVVASLGTVKYVNVNEEGEDYNAHDNLEAALAVQSQFPNDTIEVRR